uniref:T-complex 11-like 2 n=1 Tax=Nothobranchius korthausae TaxID=1143690 RepID=A0A1A8GNT0_9TELE
MPLNDERPSSTSSNEDQTSDGESSSECRESMATASDLESLRDSFNSDISSKHCTPSSSPPKNLTLGEVMEAGRDLFNLRISHDIFMNRDFQLHQNLKANSLWNAVKENVQKAFWDTLQAELNDDPPEYKHAIKLLEEIREILLLFLNPGANRMRTQIMEVLDMDLINQQADNDAVDIRGLASYVITTMGKLCCPERDGDIKKLQELNTEDIVTLFREILHVLDLMGADWINFATRSVRPVLQRIGAEYEREQFQNILDKTPNALIITTSWIQAAIQELLSVRKPAELSNDPEKIVQGLPGPSQIINAAFLRLLTWDFSKSSVPETWVVDETQLEEIQRQLKQAVAVNTVLLIVFSTIGDPIQGLSVLSDRLKRMITVLLDGMHKPDFNLKEALEGTSVQICCELNKSLRERDYPALTPEQQATLTGQICSIRQKDNPIRTLVEDRVHQYFMGLLSDPRPEVKLQEAPAGLAAIQPELGVIGKAFITLVNYNRAVYAPFYMEIMKKLLFFSDPPATSLPQEPAQESTPHD